MKMQMTLLVIVVSLVFFNSALAVEVVNGREYDSLNGIWYQIENDSLRWEVVDTLITVKYVDSATKNQIDLLNKEKGATITRGPSTVGYYDFPPWIPASAGMTEKGYRDCFASLAMTGSAARLLR